jgi:hypothetical protein
MREKYICIIDYSDSHSKLPKNGDLVIVTDIDGTDIRIDGQIGWFELKNFLPVKKLRENKLKRILK